MQGHQAHFNLHFLFIMDFSEGILMVRGFLAIDSVRAKIKERLNLQV